ncbi:DUF1987 domain-containing protein [Prodigiosinella aquatilis]|nr:DUF1987 domain-containing protein [Prodigiosinella sp. LS101]WJV55009.1 DUF1987 domain-containing protein [Prodigiosinella sp. LS101]WJV59369.1 DUF1987 domain-containing protein [Pectobacteriaceae bacterium C111]
MTETITTENLHIAGTPSSPTVDFYFDTHQLSLSGESYPENAAAFYNPLITRIQHYLTTIQVTDILLDKKINVHVSLIYFNSSSTKMLFSLFNLLNQAAENGLPIVLHWYHDQDDDITEEFGQELHLDFPALEFHSHILE